MTSVAARTGILSQQIEATPSLPSMHSPAFSRPRNSRVFSLRSFVRAFLPPILQVCASHCSTVEGAVYAGVEAGTDCYCGAAGEDYAKNGALDGDEFCATLCDSNPDSTCGGLDAIEVCTRVGER